MPVNIELKAKLIHEDYDVYRRAAVLEEIYDKILTTFTTHWDMYLHQTDTVWLHPYTTASGEKRVGIQKIREFRNGDGNWNGSKKPAELILYDRGLQADSKESTYVALPVQGHLEQAKKCCLGLGREPDVIVKKERRVFFDGATNTRIHIDQVEGLPGIYIELECIQEGEFNDREKGNAACRDIMNKMGVDPKDYIEGSYASLLLKNNPIANVL
jgi:adenylate cyclase class IV